VKVSNERDWKVLPTLSLEDSIYYSNDNVLTRKNKFLTTRHKFLVVDCTFIKSPDGKIYRARRYMPNTTKTLLKEYEDISFIKKFATKLYNDNEQYRSGYKIPCYSAGQITFAALCTMVNEKMGGNSN